MAVTQASEWKRGYLIQFPSGRSAYIRPITISMLLMVENLPNELMVVIEEWINGPRSVPMQAEELTERVGGNVSAAKSSRRWYEAFAYAAMVSPRVVQNPRDDADEIATIDMDDTDLQFLYKFLGRPAAELARFSKAQQESGVESLYDVEGFFAAPQQPVGSQSGS